MKNVVKSFLKMVLPAGVRRKLRQTQDQIFGLDGFYKGQKTAEVFDRIYREGIWGCDETGASTSGSGSHTQKIIQPYIQTVNALLAQFNRPNIVDLGCGDFNIGQHFVESSGYYIACDISGFILERNREKFQFENVIFQKLDLAEDSLPTGDIAFVRQVLQHLSNDNIHSFVTKLNDSKPYKHLLVTEHLPANEGFTPNLDKQSGPNIRIANYSGVVLDEEPFNLQYSSKEILLEVHEATGGVDAIIRTTIYNF